VEGEKVLVTGGQGSSGFPPVRLLAPDNEVWVMARFTDPAARAKVEAAGAHCLVQDLLQPFDEIPDDFTYVWHSAIPQLNSPGAWPDSFDAAADSTARLAYHLRRAKGFAFVSSASCYEPPPDDTPIKEGQPSGHHVTGDKKYVFYKIAAEANLAFVSRQFGLPVSILRMGSPTGFDGGTMVERLIKIVNGEEIRLHPRRPNNFRPHWETDLARMAVKAMEEARVPPLFVNFCGDDIVSAEDYCAYMGELVGKEPNIVYTEEGTYTSLVPDVTLMHETLGTCETSWRDMCRQLVDAKAWEKGYERPY
jgi:nucleoside-diphosphate-sugar epimerase